jgi:hypothetical protein
MSCRSVLDQGREGKSYEGAHILARFERTLRGAILGEHVVVFDSCLIPGKSLLRFVIDMAWALMRPLIGTPHRVLHTLHTPPFSMPLGFNTPVDVPNWLSCGSLKVRRCLLGLLAHLMETANHYERLG